jgi:methyltransferase-like protein
MDRAHAHRLKYLGEADFCSMSTSLNPFTASALQTIAHDRIDLEQYLDFLRNRMFRQTLLCHQDAPAGEEPLPKNLLGLFIASSAKPNTPVDPRTHDEAVFDSRHAVTTTTEPVMKAALLHLAEIWPRAASATELIAIARSRAHGEAVVVDSTQATADSRKLAEPLLRCFATSQIEVTATPSAFTTAISERPLAFPYARFQAQTSNLVTTMRHESFMLNDLQRHVLRNLDGASDRNALLDRLAALVAQGTLVLREGGRPVEAPAQIRKALVGPCATTLTQLAQNALLLA